MMGRRHVKAARMTIARYAALCCHIDTIWMGGCKAVDLGAHVGLHMHECMLLPCHNALPHFHMTYPSHIDTCMPHASIACGMWPTLFTCCVCVTGHRLIFIGNHRGPAPKTRSVSSRFSVVRDRKNIVAQQSRLVWCWWH